MPEFVIRKCCEKIGKHIVQAGHEVPGSDKKCKAQFYATHAGDKGFVKE